MAAGPRDSRDLVMLTGWDAAELKKIQLQDGTTLDSVVAMMNAGLGAFSAEVQSDPLWSSLVSYTDQPDLEYRIGASNGFSDFTEYGRPDAHRADTEGHMLPLRAYDRGLGWTWDYLRKARMSQLEADVADAIQDARDKVRVQALTRVLKRGDDSGAKNGLGSSGYSPGFATAAASTSVDFTPPQYAGNSFTSDHEHYVGIAGGNYTNAVFSDAKAELREHGHEPTYEFWISSVDESTIKGLSDFTKAGDSLVAYGANQDLAQLTNAADSPGSYYIGTIHDFAVRVVPGMPQYYGFGFKSYGPNSQRNPLRIRLQKGVSQFAASAMVDPRQGATHPIQFMMLFMEFGVGVGQDRTNGTARYVNNATWADGTPS